MRLPIEIETGEDRLAFDLFDATTLAVGISIALPGQAILTFRGVQTKEGGPGTLRLELGIEKDSSMRQAAAWLCERVGGRATAIRIGGAGVDLDPEKLERALNHHAGRTPTP